MVTICLRRRLPGASSDRYPRTGRAAVDVLLFGLAPGGVYLAGRSPGRRWALTPPFHPYLTAPLPPLRAQGARWGDKRDPAVIFCGTFLRVAPTGCCPAPCPLEPGLSSDAIYFAGGHPTASARGKSTQACWSSLGGCWRASSWCGRPGTGRS